MSLETNRLKSGLLSYSYRFLYRGRWYRGHLGPISKTKAKMALLHAKMLAAEGKHPPPKRQRLTMNPPPPMPTVAAFSQRFLDSYAVDARERSVRTTQDRLNNHLNVWLGHLVLDQVTTEAIDAYRTARRQEGAAPRTINGELATLSRLLHMAAAWKILPKASLPVIRWLRVEEKPVRVLTVEEEKRLLLAAHAHLRPLITFALHTGLRRKELLTLTWDDIDLSRREVTVTATTAKTRTRRTVPLNAVAMDALQQAHSRHGRVFGYHSVSAPMARLAQRTGLVGVNLHVLRKTFATRLLQGGCDVETVRQLLGHKNLAVILRYLQASPDHARQAVELLGGASHRRSRLPG